MSESAGPELQRRLAAAGFRPDQPDLTVLWPIIVEWASCPVDDIDNDEPDADTLLFEGILDLGEPSKYVPYRPAFLLSFARQLLQLSHSLGRTIAERGSTSSSPSPSRRKSDRSRRCATPDFGVADSFWYAGGAAADAWAQEVEKTSSFQAASKSQAFAANIAFR